MWLRNISNSGAYFESDENPLSLALEHLVKIQVAIPGIRDYCFEAKVVWVKRLELGGFGFGVTFTEEE